MTGDLSGIAVLISRPSQTARPLIEGIVRRCGIPVFQPGLHTRAADAGTVDQATTASIGPADWLVFTSPASVQFGLTVLPAATRLQTTHLWGVGRATARRLRDAGFSKVGCPGAESGVDALLADPQFKPISGERVLVVGAEGGRKKLGRVLKQAGIQVLPINVYARVPASLDPQALALLKRHFDRSILTFTSIEIMRQVVRLFDRKLPGPLQQRPAVVISQRIAAAAVEVGFKDLSVSRGPASEDIVGAVVARASKKIASGG